jgi:hypothetical protein
LGHSRPIHPPALAGYVRSAPTQASAGGDVLTTGISLIGYSITSSASDRRLSETGTPTVFAVLRLITNSNLVTCSTGRSTGLAPKKPAVISPPHWVCFASVNRLGGAHRQFAFVQAAVSRCSKLHRYSITSSARASSVDGTSRPSVLAVFRLITSSYLVGFCTGKSAVFSPFRMRLT